MKIPEKIKKGEFYVPETERKINAIIDCLHEMRLTGVGPIGVDWTAAGQIVKFTQTLQLKEWELHKAVSKINYNGPWILEIDENQMLLRLHPSEFVQVNGYYYRYYGPSTVDLADVFPEQTAEAPSEKYVFISAGLQDISMQNYYFHIDFKAHSELQPSGELRGYAALGKISRRLEGGVYKYNVESYYIGIPRILMIAFVAEDQPEQP